MFAEKGNQIKRGVLIRQEKTRSRVKVVEMLAQHPNLHINKSIKTLQQIPQIKLQAIT